MKREKLLEILTALDFMSLDMQLYLDTHPSEAEAISIYNEIVKEADKVRSVYEQNYGPLCSFRSKNTSEHHWNWIDDPWPWSECANFYIRPIANTTV